MADPASLRPEAREPAAPPPRDASARPAPPMASTVPLGSPVAVVGLQRNIGNRAVQRLLARRDGAAPRMLQRTKNLRHYAKGKEMVSQSGKNLYYIIPITSAAHISVYSTNEITEETIKKLKKVRKQLNKGRDMNLEPAQATLPLVELDFVFDEFHVTLNGTHFFYSDDGRILVKAGPSHATLADPGWVNANKFAATFLKILGLGESAQIRQGLNNQLGNLRGYPAVPYTYPPPTAEPVAVGPGETFVAENEEMDV